jgi:hypothetical protein
VVIGISLLRSFAPTKLATPLAIGRRPTLIREEGMMASKPLG